MVDNPFGRAVSGSSLFPSDDGMSKIADLFVTMAGKELSPEGIQTLMFLQQNGSSDLARAIMQNKVYQASSSDLKDFTEKFSPASYAKDQMEYQAKLHAQNTIGR